MESANSGNSEKLTPQNHNHSIQNATTTTPLEPPSALNTTLPLTNDQTNLESNLHQTSSLIEKGNETLVNNPFVESLEKGNETLVINPFVESLEKGNETLVNNPFVESHISSRLENNSSQNPFLLHSDDMHDHHSSFTPSTHESSQANPFQVPINTTTSSQKVVENHDHVHESSDDDIPISSIPNQGQQNNGSLEIQNPPIQVMERSEDSANSSAQRIPLNIFSRNKSNTQWSTASNESLFSIQMGNTSFSNDIFWLNNKSGEFEHKPSDSPLLPTQQQQQPLTKFNDISQSSAAQQNECLRLTEEKAAETMREVIMETSVTTENKSDKGNLTSDKGATRSSWVSSSNNDHSHHSDGSTKSFAFKLLADGEKTPSKGVRQQQKSQQTFQETSNAAQNPKPTSNASQKNWLSCFSCCH